MIIKLTQQERERFIAYLLQDAESNFLMARQTDKLGAHAAPVGEMLKKKAAAAIVIARDLGSVEEVTISPP